jgi:response regulator RpfG family c-di-GMP phosphodiesterase
MSTPEHNDQDDWLIDDDAPSAASPFVGSPWRILIVDDEPDVHAVTRLALQGVTYKGRGLELMSAYSAKEGMEVLRQHRDVALILLDVVMETDHAGLDMVKGVRGELRNNLSRIVLRTGQPGQAPEQEVILSYDINDYKAKTELTAQKLFTTVIASLRAYESLFIIERSRQGLDSILAASANLYQIQSLREFASGVLHQIGAILEVGADGILCVSEGQQTFEGPLQVIAATGMFCDLQYNQKLDTSSAIYNAMQRAANEHSCIFEHPSSVLYFSTQAQRTFVVYFTPPCPLSEVDQELLKVYSNRISAAFDNLYYHSQMKNAQEATVVALADLAEFRDSDTGDHVLRVQRYSSAIAQRMAAKGLYPQVLTPRFLELIGMASILHDVGKVGTPDHILHKPGKHDPEEWEIMKQHAAAGAQILERSAALVEGASYLSMGAEIAAGHHERYDGTGYPKGLAGKDIPLSARIVAVVDVFDALLHKRPYKEAWPLEDAVGYVREQIGKHFDPDVATTFLELVGEEHPGLNLPRA